MIQSNIGNVNIPPHDVLHTILAMFGNSSSYQAPKQQEDPFNTDATSNAISYNETRGEKDPYAFSRDSGSKTLGKALGKFQVTEGELKTYGNKFGVPVDSQTFLKYPGLQDTYMRNKIDFLHKEYGWSPEQIMAAHRGGFSNPGNIDQLVNKYQPYVQSGMVQYNGYKPIAEK